METVERTKARELVNTFRSAIYKNGNPSNVDAHAKECAKACCDKFCNEFIKDKEKYESYRAVKSEIDSL